MSNLRHLTSTKQIDRAWIESKLFPSCDEYRSGARLEPALEGRALYCLFYEPSFLTRTSFERAIALLGGTAYHTEDASQFFPVRSPNYIDNIINILASLHVDVVVLRSSEHGVMDRAQIADAIPVINGGSLDDHPTQALADVYTLQRELGRVDGLTVAVVGRLEHRNVSALLTALSLFNGVKVKLVAFSGQVDPEVMAFCRARGMEPEVAESVDAAGDADAIYLNAPRTLAHVQLLKSRKAFNLRIDQELMHSLKPHCIILDPMQRSGDFVIEVQDRRLAFYRQAENALFVRMAVLAEVLA